MSVRERDPLTGHETTGHEWNGITELNTGVPRIVWIFIAATFLWSLIIWLLLPSWPLVTTYTKGILGLDQRVEVEKKVVAANLQREEWVGRIGKLSANEILADPELAARVNGTAHQIFGDNCAACHGSDAAGGPGFPSLIDNAWLWNGDLDGVMETLRVGINAQHPDTRIAQMLAFGRDGLLTREQVIAVVAFVQSLSETEAPIKENPAGAEIFAENCASCHGEKGAGDIELGAPDLTDAFWIYGGNKQAIFESIWNGRQGQMPAWETRLTTTDRKILAVYLQHLRQENTQ